MTKKRTFSIILFSVLTLSFTAFIFSNSLLVAEESAARSGRFIPFLQKLLESIGIDATPDSISFFIRKTAHFLEYFILSALVSGTVLSATDKQIFLSLAPIYSLIIAITDEFVMQAVTEGRSPEWRDVSIDTIGALLAAAVILLFLKLTKRNRR